MQSVSIIVKGKVQGVFFRQSAKEKATELGITGQIKNIPDGRVCIIANGETDCLNKFVDWCKRGPSGAIVSDIETRSEPFQNFDTFSIIRQ